MKKKVVIITIAVVVALIVVAAVSMCYVQPSEFGCSFITTKDKDGNVLTGRNFDKPYSTAIQ